MQVEEIMKSKGSIIIVDDDEYIRQNISLYLKAKGYDVETAISGQDALKKAREKHFNVVLLDINLPDVVGTELLATLKETYVDIEVIMITGSDDVDYAISALNKGASGYILKPLNVDNLLSNVKNTIDKQHLIIEKRQAEQETQQRNREISALLEASRAVLEHKEFKMAASSIFDSCAKLINATAGYIALFTPDKKENQVIFLEPGNLKCEVDPSLSMPIRGMRSEVVKLEKAMYHNDFLTTDWVKFLPKGHVKLKNVMFAPLIINKEVKGLMGLSNKPGGFTDDDAKLAMAFAELASIALMNSHTLESLENSEQKYRHLSNELEQIVEERTTELQLSEASLTNAQRIAHLGNWDWDIVKNDLSMSNEMYRIIGLDPHEFGATIEAFLDTVHPDDRNSVQKGVDKALYEKIPYNIDHRILLPDGSIRIVNEQAEVNFDETGKPIKMTGTLQDITERKKAEQKLKDSEEKIQNLINNISDVLIEANSEGEVTYISHQIINIIGYHPNDLIGLKFTDLIHPEDLVLYHEAMKKAQDKNEPTSLECRVKHKKGYYIQVSAKGSLVEIDNKNKFIGVIRDISERKRVEDMIKKEIKKLKELDRIKSDLVRRISHELKTPLISIYSGAQYLLNFCNDELSDNIQNIIKIIHKGGNRMRDMVDNLIIAYELESEGMTLNLQREDIIPILRNCIETTILEAKKRNIFMNVEILGEYYLKIDKSKFSRAIINILSNAVKNTPVNGNIYIKTFEHPDYLDIIIQDTGVGITQKEIPLLFKKFGKIERYGKGLDVDIEGPGMGLYISNEIVKLHNGEILVKSKGRKKGATFTIRLFLK